jgi:hypothetical protein
MTALTTERGAKQDSVARIGLTLASGFKAWKGAKIAINLLTGKVQPAAALATAHLLVIGAAHETVDATAADKELEVDLDRDFFGRWWANSGVTAVAAGDIGRLCYFEDDQTVCADALAGQPVAGRIWAVSATRGVFVEQLAVNPGGAPFVSATPLFVANDLVVPAWPAHGALIDVPTTAGASTVTLPAASQEGTVIHFVADGTKNGHTVQYRDATGPTNLTTALTASKRHLVVAAFLNSKWMANAYVAP